jgi:murein DD-endopeptidase MepM/ murein hydrolase activator NlpD
MNLKTVTTWALAGLLTAGSATLTAQAAPRVKPGTAIYTVRKGDSLSSIAQRFGMSVQALRHTTGIIKHDRIRAGQPVLVRVRGARQAPSRVVASRSVTRVTASRAVASRRVAVSGRSATRVSSARRTTIVSSSARRTTIVSSTARRAAQAQATRAAQAKATRAAAQARAVRAQLAQRQRQEVAARAAKARIAAAKARTAAAKARARRASFTQQRDSGGYGMPARGVLTSGFGYRSLRVAGSRFHTGIDIAGGYGSPIYAARSGTVTQARFGYYGRNVYIQTSGSTRNIYGHMSRLAVRAGQYVRRGQVIGYMGCSGICTGTHLHFEVQVNGRAVNPWNYLR